MKFGEKVKTLFKPSAAHPTPPPPDPQKAQSSNFIIVIQLMLRGTPLQEMLLGATVHEMLCI